MRILKRIGIAIAALIGVLIVVGLFLPREWHTQRSIVIAAGGDHILPLIDTPRRWIEWAPWTPERYPGMEIEYGDIERGAGAWWSWRGEVSGNGRMDIHRSDVADGIDFALLFEGFAPTAGSIRFEEAEGGTEVTWSMSGDNGWNLVSRYFGVLMDSMMQSDFESGLTKLKRKAEEAKAEAEREAAEREAAEREAAEREAAEALEEGQGEDLAAE